MKTDIEQLSVEELAAGVRYDAEKGCYYCIHCPARFEEGEVYALEGRFFEAKRAALLHVEQAHGGALEALLSSGSRYLTLTDSQRELLQSLHRGVNDREIAGRCGIAASTVRHQRFILREKAKQARMFLALYLLAMQKMNKQEELIAVHDGANMVDERYEITEAEQEKILQNAFSSLQPLRLSHFPKKEKKKVAILTRIAQEFTPGRRYSEPEVNQLLGGIYPDFATLRRYLIEYGFMQRTTDCREYWLSPAKAQE